MVSPFTTIGTAGGAVFGTERVASVSTSFEIPKAVKRDHIEQNASATDFEMERADIDSISRTFSDKPEMIDPDRIMVSLEGQGNRKAYTTLEQALANELNMQPSPEELAGFILQGEPIKPVRVVCSTLNDNKFDYELVEGRLRYWAWVIAFNGKKEVPCYIRK